MTTSTESEAGMPDPKPKDPITYLVQLATGVRDGHPAWLDVTEVDVPPRTNIEGILEATKTQLAPLLTGETAPIAVRAIAARDIRETTVGLQQDPVLRIGGDA